MATSTQDVQVVIKADDQATPKINAVGTSFGKLTASFAAGQLAVDAFRASFGAIQDFVVGSFTAFIDAEKEMTVANTALQNAFDDLSEKQVKNLKAEFGSVHVSIKQVEDAMGAAGEAAVKLGYDDEQASVAFAKLFQVSGSVKQAQNDLSLAMDLAAYSGRGLEESAAAVTKVHAGATRVLKEFGMEVKEGTTAEEALSLLHDRTKNSAENMAKSTAGQLKVLSIEWQNLQETVGGALAEAITPFITQLTEWASKPETQQKIKEIVEALAAFIKTTVEFVQKHWPEFKFALQVMGEMLRIVWSTLTGVWNGFQMVLTGIKSFTDAIKAAVDWIGSLIQKLQDLAKEMAKGVLGSVGNFGKTLTSPIDKLMKFDDGGVIPGPLGMAIPILAHAGETVLPTHRSGIAGTIINVTVTGNTILNDNDAERLGDKIIERLQMSMRI